MQMQDAPVPLNVYDVVLILENSCWFPNVLATLESMKKGPGRPLLAVWHWEPLPMPRSAGVPLPSLSVRELAKAVLKDIRATDVYTNLARLTKLSKKQWPDLLMVSSQAWQESLAERGIGAHWVPYGYAPEYGAPTSGPRDIEALFLGALNVPRRSKAIRQLRRSGIDLVTRGSWFDKTYWGKDRTRLINRSKAFINIQRYAGEISAHRLILGMANKSLVISEPIYKPAPFIPGEHYVETEVGNMPATLNFYRTQPEERARIADRAYSFVSEELRMDASISRILSLVADYRNQSKRTSWAK